MLFHEAIHLLKSQQDRLRKNVDLYPHLPPLTKKILDEEKETDAILFFITDILNEESTVLVYDQFTKDLVSNSFEVQIADGADTQLLPGIISRKKQIIPMLKLPN